MVRQNWRLHYGQVSKEQCERITKKCYQNCKLADGTIFGDGVESHRKTKVGWTEDKEITELAQYHISKANEDAFNVDISYLPPLQFAEYSLGSFYGWHHDVNWEQGGLDRKLSFVLQLTDPSLYEGGDFQFKEVENPTTFREQGSILIFPSYLLHQVTPITRGKRNSIVGWMEGPKWK